MYAKVLTKRIVKGPLKQQCLTKLHIYCADNGKPPIKPLVIKHIQAISVLKKQIGLFLRQMIIPHRELLCTHKNHA